MSQPDLTYNHAPICVLPLHCRCQQFQQQQGWLKDINDLGKEANK